jgi:hypothetical protein
MVMLALAVAMADLQAGFGKRSSGHSNDLLSVPD